jgi:hypothetical protein
MGSYKEEYGALPEKAEQLTRNYPHNLLPGLTDIMRKAYEVYNKGKLAVDTKEGNSAIEATAPPSNLMKKEDIEELFDMTSIGTKVTIGKVKLPTESVKEKTRFHTPQLREETNPSRIYKWLN